MLLDSIPSRFNALDISPATFQQKFVDKFKKCRTPKDSLLDELINLFGQMNQTQIATLLPQTLAKKIKARLASRSDRFSFLLNSALKDLMEHRQLSLEKFETLYKSSTIFSSATIQALSVKRLIISCRCHCLIKNPCVCNVINSPLSSLL